MILNKIAITLLFITLNMQLATSTIPRDTLGGQIYLMNLLHERQERASKPKKVLQSTNNTMNDAEVQEEITESPSDIQGSSPSGKSAPSIRKRTPVSKSKKNVLQDTTSIEEEVQPVKEGVGEVVQTPEQSAPPVNKQFEELIEQGEYDKIFGLGEKMNKEEFMEQLCHVVETPHQYKGVVDYLRSRKMVASFYIHGDNEVVKEAIIESRVYDDYNHYVKDGDLETALSLALEKDFHDRFIELLVVRKEITAEKDGQRKLEGEPTSFGWFMFHFLGNLAPWRDGMALRRFLILRGDELREKYHDILDTLSRQLVSFLCNELHSPKVERLLFDLIGQPSLSLTPAVFAKVFLYFDSDVRRSTVIKYGWDDAIKEGLKSEYEYGGEKLWRVMQTKQPNQFHGEFPETEEARTAVCVHFLTKRQKQKEWYKKYFMIFFNKFNSESISYIFPDELWSIIIEYALSLIFTWNLTTSTE